MALGGFLGFSVMLALLVGSAKTVEAAVLVDTPTTPVLDYFNRASENPVSQAGKWASTAIDGGTRLQVANTLLQGTGATGSAYRQEALVGDMEVYASIAASPQNHNGVALFVNLHDVGTAGWDGYGFRIYKLIGGYQWRIYSYTNGVGTELSTGSFSGAPLGGERVLFRRQGTSLEAYHYTGGEWTLRVSALVDGSSDGRIGVQIIDGGFGGVPVLDDVGGTESLAVPPVPSALPATPVLDDFNRVLENPLSQGGAWASTNPGGVATHTLDLESLQGRNTNVVGEVRSYLTTSYSGYVEAYFTVAAMPGNGLWIELLMGLNDVGSAAWDGYRLIVLDAAIDQFIINRVTNGANTGLGTPVNRNVAVGDRILARRVGNRLEFWHDVGGIGAWTKIREVTDSTYMSGRIGAGLWKKNGAIENFGGGNIVAEPNLLQLYAPELRWHTDEVYYADSAATMADNYQSDEYRNMLHMPDFPVPFSVLAASEPGYDDYLLSLDFLHPDAYPTDPETEVTTADFINAADEDPDGDAQRMHDDPLYRNKAYGTVISSGSNTYLQYWFFYYNNPKTFVGFGAHEGDWEMIQVRLDAMDEPMGATYAQHGDGEFCQWSSVELTSDGRPVVYVADGSHASYFWAGEHDVLGPDQHDHADGENDESPTTPSYEAIDYEEPPLWMQWPGHWGEGGPQAPPHQDPWEDPVAFESNAASCTPEPSPRRAGQTTARHHPLAPKVEARRDGAELEQRQWNGQ